MTRDVLVTVRGVQTMAGMPLEDNEAIELVTCGTYDFREGCHVLEYDEVFEDVPGTTHNYLKIREDCAEVIKTGQANVDMIFEVGKKSIAAYSTPYGALDMAFEASRLEVTKKEERLTMLIEYALSMNNQYVADCRLSVDAEFRS
ncbi:MAG: DUF1934 domain-containing protein [Lachnospiraceae bacterium]|nr:DUF1934 domain-containing protein [Lachnospiraceae bacterium]